MPYSQLFYWHIIRLEAPDAMLRAATFRIHAYTRPRATFPAHAHSTFPSYYTRHQVAWSIIMRKLSIRLIILRGAIRQLTHAIELSLFYLMLRALILRYWFIIAYRSLRRISVTPLPLRVAAMPQRSRSRAFHFARAVPIYSSLSHLALHHAIDYFDGHRFCLMPILLHWWFRRNGLFHHGSSTQRHENARANFA
jgi:hypothetical protein